MAECSNRMLKMKELVSIIIPVYQVEKYLADCIRSVICQTYSTLEIILVDDGSTDNSSWICDQFAQLDSRIKVIHKCNGGLSSARNAGIDICTGEFITFIDSDDVVADVMIGEMVYLAKKEDADVVKIGVIRKNKYSDAVAIAKSYKTYTGKEALTLLFHSNSQIITGCGKLFTKKVIGDLRFPVGRYFEDEYFTPRIYLRAKRVVLCDSEYYFYMQRSNDSIMRGNITDKKIQDSIWVSIDRIDLFSAYGNCRLVREATMDYYYKIEHLLIRIQGDNNGARHEIKDYLIKLKSDFKTEHFWLYKLLNIKKSLYLLYKRIFYGHLDTRSGCC